MISLLRVQVRLEQRLGMLFSPLGLLSFGLLAQTECSISLISDPSPVRTLSVLLRGI